MQKTRGQYAAIMGMGGQPGVREGMVYGKV